MLHDRSLATDGVFLFVSERAIDGAIVYRLAR